jgi:hypothetical protein
MSKEKASRIFGNYDDSVTKFLKNPGKTVAKPKYPGYNARCGFVCLQRPAVLFLRMAISGDPLAAASI